MASDERESAEPELRLLAPAGGARVPFRMQRLEPAVGFAVAGAAAWSAIFFHPPGTVWLLALYAAAVAAWARTWRAQTPAMLFLRAALLQVGGWLLLAAPGFGGPLGPALLWPLGITVGYALLLPTRWAAPMAALGLGGFVHALFAEAAGVPWQTAMAFAGALGAMTVLAVAMGRSFRTGEREAESARLDPGTRLYNETGFFANGGQLFDECRRGGRPFTLVLLAAADLHDAVELLGRKAANGLFSEVVKGISAATPPQGLAARLDTTEFAVAMPGLAGEKAEALLRQHLGQPAKVRVRVGDHEAAIMLDAVIAQAPAELHTLEDLYDRLHRELRKRGDPVSTSPMTDTSLLSTLQGVLLQEPRLPSHQRPTLPMSLPNRPPARGGAARA